MNDLAKHIGRQLSYLRERREMSQRLLADASGIPHSSLAAYERGESSPSAETLWKLSVFFEVNPGIWFEFYGDDDPLVEWKMEIMPASEYEERKASMAETVKALREVW